MFCCLGGNSSSSKEPPRELAVNLKNKKPEDFMKETIPISLSENITFLFNKDRKWTAKVNRSQRTDKKGDSDAMKKKIADN